MALAIALVIALAMLVGAMFYIAEDDVQKMLLTVVVGSLSSITVVALGEGLSLVESVVVATGMLAGGLVISSGVLLLMERIATGIEWYYERRYGQY